MSQVISVHEYVLKPGTDETQFEQAIQKAQQSGLLQLPGLTEHYLVKGIRGTRKGCYAAVWVYESREAWEDLWGPLQQPISKEDYPENWRAWESQVLAPFLDREPDTIRFTAYVEL